MTITKSLTVRVDRDKCQGHGRCHALAPGLFGHDEFGYSRVLGDGSVPAALREAAYRAKSNCPECAIEITDSESQ